MLNVSNVSGGYNGATVLHSVTFNVERGEVFGIIGPNGSGKTTLLHLLSGIRNLSSGEITIKGKALNSYSSKELARTIAVLSQQSSQAFSYTVKETISLGRYAHQKGWLQSWSPEDEEVVRRVLADTGTAPFADARMDELSGGERQRVMLAQALAQEPEILLLDEPTNHLDLAYQKDLLDAIRKWSREKGLTVVSIFHDLNLAGMYCDRLLLLDQGEVRTVDKPNRVLQEERIQEVYGTKIENHPHPALPKPHMYLMPEQGAGNHPFTVTEALLQENDLYISLHSPVPLRTMSSGVTGAGAGWYTDFVNRQVPYDYQEEDHKEEMGRFLLEHGFDPIDTVGMMTAVDLKFAATGMYGADGFSVFIVITAGIGNAVDASRCRTDKKPAGPGTINTWIFVNASLAEEAFIHCIVTATEAKVRALQEMDIQDRISGTPATGTSTDSILVASVQQGRHLPYGGTATPLGEAVGQGVYECTIQALKNNTGIRGLNND